MGKELKRHDGALIGPNHIGDDMRIGLRLSSVQNLWFFIIWFVGVFIPSLMFFFSSLFLSLFFFRKKNYLEYFLMCGYFFKYFLTQKYIKIIFLNNF
jgi:hypothetical protein